MREIVIISGKGGTGKTSITAALAFVAGEEAVIADCDVDASDMHLLLKPDVLKREPFYSGYKALIDSNKCVSCDKCRSVCRFNAVVKKEDKYTIDPVECEGCSYCSHICPSQAITMEEQNVGEGYLGKTLAGSLMSYAKLGIGAGNSGKLVAKVKQEAKNAASAKGCRYILIDGSPGIGCPVIASLSGADYAVIVTEPTISGFSDMRRVIDLASRFNIPLGCIINKADINPDVAEQIKKYIEAEKIALIDTISYDDDFHRAITEGVSLVLYNPYKWASRIHLIWKRIRDGMSDDRYGERIIG